MKLSAISFQLTASFPIADLARSLSGAPLLSAYLNCLKPRPLNFLKFPFFKVNLRGKTTLVVLPVRYQLSSIQ
jgi:hypothetical protein